MNRKRGDQHVIMVDPRILFEIGIPVLHYIEEMAYYKIHSQYKYAYWNCHHLCVWEVTPEEVVGRLGVE